MFTQKAPVLIVSKTNKNFVEFINFKKIKIKKNRFLFFENYVKKPNFNVFCCLFFF